MIDKNTKQQNQGWPVRTLVFQNVSHIYFYLHARNKGFPLSNNNKDFYTFS